MIRRDGSLHRVPAGERRMDLVLAEAKRRGVAVLADYDASGRFLRWSAVPWPR